MAISIITIPTKAALSRNPIRVETLSSGYSTLANYRVVIRILFEKSFNSDNFEEVVEVEAIPDPDGICRFDFSRTLHAELVRNRNLKIPTIDDQHPFALDSTRRFKVEYLERFGEPQEDGSSSISSPVKLLHGGVDQHYHGLNDFFSNINATNSILSYMPDGRRVHRDEANFITYLNHRSTHTLFALKVRSWSVTGNELDVIWRHKGISGGPDDPPGVEIWQAATYPVTASVMGLAASAVKFSVQVWSIDSSSFDEVEAVSQEVTFYIEENYVHRPSTIIWLGGFANPQILTCTGNRESRLQVDRMMSRHIFTNNADPRQMSSRQHQRDFNTPWTFYTEPLTEDEALALQEMLIENELFEFAPDGNCYRLQLTGKDYDITKVRRTPNSLKFQARRALLPGNFMLLPVTGDGQAATEGSWQKEDGGLWELNSGDLWLTNQT